jgi:iron(III) transport system ATP-binding protein
VTLGAANIEVPTSRAGASAGAVPGSADPRRPVVKVDGLRKHFRRNDGTEVPAIDDVSFELHAGEIMVLLGPSGCGKTTLLRCIAGLEHPDAGTIEVQNQTVFSSARQIDVRAERRKLSMVFQSYALWPHMTVFSNIAYPIYSMPRSQRPSKQEIVARVAKIMEIVGIPGLEKQHPNAISGGQQQRVALCRSLIAGSDLVLFDEPLSNVDAQVREQLRLELLLMQRELHFAALFVTHDRQEAMALANSIAVLDTGKVAQLGTPTEIYNAPVNRYVANFIGPTNEWKVTSVSKGRESDVLGDTGHGLIHGRSVGEVDLTADTVAVWRPECGVVTTERSTADNCWSGVVEQSSFYGAHTEYILRVGDKAVRVLTTGNELIPNGTAAWVSVDAAKVLFLAAS